MSARGKSTARELDERAARARALLKALKMSHQRFSEVSGLVRNNVSSALAEKKDPHQARTSFTSSKWTIGFSRASGAPEDAVRKYLLDGGIDLDTLLSERSEANSLRRDARTFISELMSTRGLHAYLDATADPVELGEVVDILAAIRTGAVAAYARADGFHDFEALFRDYRSGKLRASGTAGDTSGRARAIAEQEEELGGVVPKKIKFDR